MKTDNKDVFHAPHLSPAFIAALGEKAEQDGGELTEPWARALLIDAVRARASDIHFDPQFADVRVRFRIDGAVREIASLRVEERVYDLILAGEDEQALRENLRAAGFRPLLRDALQKAADGITDFTELTRIGAQSYLDRAPRSPGGTA
jgi:type II secretory ATPase GspE/PulE/Tfp pilus assembly ATPase PilB-like protein